MTSIDSQTTNGSAPTAPDPTSATTTTTATGTAVLSSPFALTEVATHTSPAGQTNATSPVGMTSPFLDGLLSEAGVDAESQIATMLLAELDDEEFAEALEALANEAAARSIRAPLMWSEDDGAPVVDTTEAEQWMEGVAARAVDAITELERHFGDRSVESIGDHEIDQVLGRTLPGYLEAGATGDGSTDPLDAQELFFKKLGSKLKKAVKGATSLVKKGIMAVSKILPIGKILERLKGIIRPLLDKVLAKAIGKLPKSLQKPARQLAKKFGLSKEVEHENEYQFLAAEFDAGLAEALFASDAEFAALEAELLYETQSDAVEPNLATELDRARLRLGRALEAASPGEPPVEAMEQFIPAAILPIAKMGIKIAGRKRVIDFLAGLLAKLIAPIVGQQLARPLSTQIADKGLAIIGLEAESAAGESHLGSEAVVAATEEALNEVFSLPEAWLENEMLLEVAVSEAFHEAVKRHLPDTVLRPELTAKQDAGDRGVWLMMPRNTAPAFRYKQYSKRIPVKVTSAMARSAVFSNGETLDDRLHDEGLDNYPVDVELEYVELLPGGELGHVAPTAGSAGSLAATSDAGAARALEYDTFEDPGALPVPEGERRRRGKAKAAMSAARRADTTDGAGGGTGRRANAARKAKGSHVRVTARGRALHRRRPVAVKIDVSGSSPTVTLHVALSERRALEVAEKLGKQQHREVLAMATKLADGPVREHVAKRLKAMLDKHQIAADESAATALSGRLFDGLVAALGSQIEALTPQLTAAAKDPAAGLTISAAYSFPSAEALTTGEPEPPTLTIRPGQHRD